MKNIYIIILLLLASSTSAFSQGETNIWHFGINAGLDFNSLPAVAITDGMVNAHGGSAAMSDANGNLLFYTQGMTLWDQNHTPMPNGLGLEGHASSTQNSMIIAKPGSTDLYYVFANGRFSDGLGLSYSEVDMNLNGGLGDVNSNKNIPLLDSTCEKLTATYHANQIDYWLITHERNTSNFYAYPITAAGIGAPIISASGIAHQGLVAGSDVLVGQLKASPDGTRLALATSAGNNTFEIFDFDNNTGVVSNPITISGPQYEYPYGVEFSPDGTMLYCSSTANNKVYQFNLTSGSASAIIASEVVIAEPASTIGALQLGPDSRIYIARYNSFYLGVINSPNLVGLNSDYVDDGVSLGSKRSRTGLPNFISSYFNNPRFLYSNVCFSDSTVFYISDLNGVNSVLWDFGDPASSANNTSTSTDPVHIFSAPGAYDVSLTRNFPGFSDNVTQTINVHALPDINLGPNEIFLCDGQDTTLSAGNLYESYLWNNQSITYFIEVNTPGMYSLTVTDDFGCENSDSVEVSLQPAPEVELGPDTYICQGNMHPLDASFSNSTYEWSNGPTSATQAITEAGNYFVTVTNICGSAIDSIKIDYYATIAFSLGEDQELCPGDSVTLDPGDLGVNYSWSTGSTDQTITANSTGSYSLMAYYSGINCPKAYDTVLVSVLDNPVVIASNDTTICEGEVAQLFASGNFITNYNWSDNQSGQSIAVSQEGLYVIFASNICSSDTDSVYVSVIPQPNVDVGPDTTIFDDETIVLNATYNSAWNYEWTPSTSLSGTTISNPEASPQQTITYTLVVTDEVGCQGTANITIDVNERPLPEIEIYNTFSPNGDNINDTWVIKNIEKYENNYLEIYNRNGNLIYSQENYQNDWDGTFNDNPVPAHVYFYILNLGVPDEKIRNGHVTIIR